MIGLVPGEGNSGNINGLAETAIGAPPLATPPGWPRKQLLGLAAIEEVLLVGGRAHKRSRGETVNSRPASVPSCHRRRRRTACGIGIVEKRAIDAKHENPFDLASLIASNLPLSYTARAGRTGLVMHRSVYHRDGWTT